MKNAKNLYSVLLIFAIAFGCNKSDDGDNAPESSPSASIAITNSNGNVVDVPTTLSQSQDPNAMQVNSALTTVNSISAYSQLTTVPPGAITVASVGSSSGRASSSENGSVYYFTQQTTDGQGGMVTMHYWYNLNQISANTWDFTLYAAKTLIATPVKVIEGSQLKNVTTNNITGTLAVYDMLNFNGQKWLDYEYTVFSDGGIDMAMTYAIGGQSLVYTVSVKADGSGDLKYATSGYQYSYTWNATKTSGTYSITSNGTTNTGTWKA